MIRCAADPAVALAVMGERHGFAPLGVRRFLREVEVSERTGTARFRAIECAGQFVGCVHFENLDYPNARAEMRLWLGAPYRGRGIAADAGAMAVKFAFDELGLHRLEAYPAADCARSSALLKRLGFTCEGKLRHAVREGAVWKDVAVWARLADD